MVAARERYSPAVLRDATPLPARDRPVGYELGRDRPARREPCRRGRGDDPDADAEAVADMALSLMLASLRRLPVLDLRCERALGGRRG